MGLFVRSLLLWLLVLAVPAQGMAAAAMVFCGPNHHAGGGQGTQHHHADAQAGQESPAADADAAPRKLVHADPHKCSACASCCSAAAILNSAPVVPAPEVSSTEFVAVVPTVDPFVAGGPDRPPRARRA